MTRPEVVHSTRVSWVEYADGTMVSCRGPHARVRAEEVASGAEALAWLRSFVEGVQRVTTGRIEPLNLTAAMIEAQGIVLRIDGRAAGEALTDG